MSTKQTFVQRLFLAAALAALLAGLLTPVPVSARPAGEDYIPNATAEQLLRQDLINYGFADLTFYFEDEADRVIDGQFLADTLKLPDVQRWDDVWILNTTVVDLVYMSSTTLDFDLIIDSVHFTGPVYLDAARVGWITITNSSFDDTVNLNGISSSGTIDIENSMFYGDAWFPGLVTSGSLVLVGNTFFEGVNLSGATIGADMELWSSEFMASTSYGDGRAGNFRQISVGRTADMQAATFHGLVIFESCTINTANFQGVTFGGLADFSRTVIQLDANFDDSTFAEDANFMLFAVERSADFNRVQFHGPADFSEASLGRASFVDASFDSWLSMSEAQVTTNLDLSNARFNSSDEYIDLSHMRVGESILLINLQAPGNLALDRTRATELIIIGAQDGPALTELSLWLTKTGDQFLLADLLIGSLLADGASFDGTTNISNVSITEEFDLRNTRLQLLVIDGLSWPQEPDAFDMRGMTYADIDLGEGELTEDTWKQLLYIVQESTYSPQAYRALAVFLTEKGHPDWANQVSLAMKRRERSEALAPLSAAWLWSWFLEIFAGYGYNPALAFLWSLLVVGAGAFVFRREQDMLRVDQDEVKLHYHPLLYSFALFLPYIDLGVAAKWEPNPDNRFTSTYKHIHRLLGWVLMPVALLAFSGILG